LLGLTDGNLASHTARWRTWDILFPQNALWVENLKQPIRKLP